MYSSLSQPLHKFLKNIYRICSKTSLLKTAKYIAHLAFKIYLVEIKLKN